MPTYTVFAPAGRLSPPQKQQIAREVTQTHSAVTGAQTFFAQVIFQDVIEGNWFMGGAPLESAQIYVCAHIRGGRPAELKRELVLRLRDVLSQVAGAAPREVWVYLVELPPAQMVEYGRILPEPGQEAAWLDDMPAEERARLEALGR